jgi:sialate O-acetylesterase
MAHRTLPGLARAACLAILIGTGAHSARANITLPQVFGDGMVLQRDSAAPLWGDASPGETVTAEFNGQTASATADGNGKWSTAFKGLKEGGPFTLTIKGAADTVTISNVLVGDVWLCSGQSNMAFNLYQMGALAKKDVAAAADPDYRWYGAATYMVEDPYKGRKWMSADPRTISGLSAVAYYFGRSLRNELHVPIGILSVSFPGSCIEGWMTPEGLKALGMEPEAKTISDEYAALDKATPKFLDALAAWEKGFGRQDPGDEEFAKGWADPNANTSDWKSIPNFADWSSLGVPNGGVVWVRKSFEIPPETAGTDLTVDIGDLRNGGKEFGNVLGTVYFNNQKVGVVGGSLKHIYTSPEDSTVYVPGSLVHAGTNVLAVRFFAQKGKAPYNKTLIHLQGTTAKKAAVPTLSPDCLAKVAAVLPPEPPEAAESRPPVPPAPSRLRLPSLLYDYMLRQVAGYGIKGVLWYQGEANTESFGGAPPSVLGNYPPVAYRKLLPGLIADWRRIWKQDDLPFYFVQLPNINIYTQANPDAVPQKRSDWAALREAQLLTWQAVPHTGLVVTIDTGNGELHPPNKQPVGERAALVALGNAYGQKAPFSGPVYDSMTVEGNKIRLRFKDTDGGLKARSGVLKEFAIAGEDRKFAWADAVIDGDSVVVSSPEVAVPVAVRYAWADDPLACNLYNGAGLPASPFRTDDWPLP